MSLDYYDDEHILANLRDMSSNPMFSEWNESVIAHLSVSLIGCNGNEARALCLQLFSDYISYKTHHPWPNDGSFLGNPSKEYVEKILLRSIYIHDIMKNSTLRKHEILDVWKLNLKTEPIYPFERKSTRSCTII